MFFLDESQTEEEAQHSPLELDQVHQDVTNEQVPTELQGQSLLCSFFSLSIILYR